MKNSTNASLSGYEEWISPSFSRRSIGRRLLEPVFTSHSSAPPMEDSRTACSSVIVPVPNRSVCRAAFTTISTRLCQSTTR